MKKKIILHTATILGSFLLFKWSEQFDGSQWIFALLTVGVFLGFLQGWKKLTISGVGLVVVTAFTLFMINSILYLLMPTIFIILSSICVGLLLIPLYRIHPDAVLTAWTFVLLNILIHIEMETELSHILTFLILGIATLVGYHFQFSILRKCFTFLFLLNAFLLLFLHLFSNSYTWVLLIGFILGVFFVATKWFSKKTSSR